MIDSGVGVVGDGVMSGDQRSGLTPVLGGAMCESTIGYSTCYFGL